MWNAWEYRRANPLFAHDAASHNGFGNMLRDEGKRDEAIAEYRQAIHLDPHFAAPRNNLGILLRDEGKRDEAAAEFREAKRLGLK
jgi:Flp pilus assembly protein TadD